MSQPVIVIGGGISGLVCLDRLVRSGVEALLLEERPRVGGVIRSRREGDALYEVGPNTVQGNPGLRELADELGLGPALVEAPAALPRYVFAGGCLHAVPFGPLAFLGSRLLSAGAKVRALTEWRVRRRTERFEESVESFFDRRFGPEILRRIVSPLISGTWAGDPSALSVEAVFPSLVALEREFGSVTLGALRSGFPAGEGPGARRLVSFRDGLEALPAALGRKHADRIRTGVTARWISRRQAGYEIHVADGPSALGRAIVLAVPAPSAADLLAPLLPDSSAALREIPHPPLAVVSVVVPRLESGICALRGFGALVAPGEGVRMLGTVWASSMFPDRASEGRALLSVFIGGATDPGGGRLSDQELDRVVPDGLGRVLGIGGRIETLAIDRFERAIPQYVLGHRERIERIRRGLGTVPGIHVAGNWIDGISVGDCIRSGQETAEQVRGTQTTRATTPTS